jgi:hypothetical protein
LAPVALLSSNPYLVVARNGLPAQNLQELITWKCLAHLLDSAGNPPIGARDRRLSQAETYRTPSAGCRPSRSAILHPAHPTGVAATQSPSAKAGSRYGTHGRRPAF